MKASLDRRKPKPHYSLYTKENNSYARIIYEPDSKDPTYESLAKLPAQSGQAAILARCEQFLVAVERRPRARLS